ncbi:hypothetical protein BJK06_11440 [Curtobacterium sp. BH-2-1-1]|uniref:hypothetical protein n=1 Tax=Curtobacterium sp. BH-2-1-1 TaxID=1905847 RepID=UPI00089DD8C5|nr:hypothetical protein [Curtobacterium sp. BH-2-1-1]AOX66286.1 hypothetical protein BJK06_11440 [Curtobacterium sp. BH-2-1-1]
MTRRAAHSLLLVVAASIVWSVLVAPAGVAAAGTGSSPEPGIGVQLLPGAEATDRSPTSRYIRDTLRPGQTVERTIRVTNASDTERAVSMTTTAAGITDGAFRIDTAPRSELTDWIGLDPASVDVPARSSALVRVRIAVPPDATGGERYAVVWAATASERPDGTGLRMVSRVGVRSYVAVSGPAALRTAFRVSEPRVGPSGDERTVLADVRNTGERAVDLTGTLVLADGPAGAVLPSITGDRPRTLAPGQRAALTFTVPAAVAPGTWLARIAVTDGVTTERTAGSIALPSASPRAATRIDRASGSHPSVGLVPVLLVLLVLASATVTALALRRRRSTTAPTPPEGTPHVPH